MPTAPLGTGPRPVDISSSPASTAAANYIEAPGFRRATSQIIWETDVTGDLGKMGVQLPTASSGLGVAVGTDWRQEKRDLYPDEELITNDLAGQGAPILPAFGAFHVWEATPRCACRSWTTSRL